MKELSLNWMRQPADADVQRPPATHTTQKRKEPGTRSGKTRCSTIGCAGLVRVGVDTSRVGSLIQQLFAQLFDQAAL